MAFLQNTMARYILSESIQQIQNIESTDVPGVVYQDARIIKEDFQVLEKQKNYNQPLFLAVGFYRSYLSFYMPKSIGIYTITIPLLLWGSKASSESPSLVNLATLEIKYFFDCPPK